MNRISEIVDSRGQPFRQNGQTRQVKGFWSPGLSTSTDLGTFYQKLSGVSLPPIIKSRQPFAWHSWIFASAMSIATVATSAPFTIFRETEEEMRSRQKAANRRGRKWRGPRAGKERRAVVRWIRNASVAKRVSLRGLEVDDEHPLWNVLLNPNPYQKGDQLFWLTHLWLALRSHCIWVMTDGGGNPVLPGDTPERIWPLSPDLFQPILSSGSHGELVGWKLRLPVVMRGPTHGFEMNLPRSSVIEFKVTNPDNFLSGISRVGVTIDQVQQDLALLEYNRRLAENRGEPSGVVMYDVQMSKKEEEEWLASWEQRHQGTDNAGNTALLSGGMKYMPIALSPGAMQGREQMEWHRGEHLAVMGTPPSQIGITEFTNYATALGQKADYWHNRILPQTKLVDTCLDATLFGGDTDDIVGMHDLRGVDALRAGIADKVATAEKLCNSALHATPIVAYEVVGLEVPEYDGNDVSIFANAFAEDPDDPETPDDEDGEDRIAPGVRTQPKTTKNRAGAFADMQSPHEARMRKRYLRWVRSEERQTLRRFDEEAKALRQLQKDASNLTAILPTPAISANNLRARVRPLYSPMLSSVFEFTMDDINGIPLFSLTDDNILAVFEAREQHFVTRVPATVRNNLQKSLTTGLQNGETIQQLRARISEVYGISASGPRSLMIARTETAGYMNSSRREMFRGQGIEKIEWSTAQDEVVREDHQVFGSFGPVDMGFNFIDIAKTGSGVLEYPGDPNASANQVVNCRCVEVPG